MRAVARDDAERRSLRVMPGEPTGGLMRTVLLAAALIAAPNLVLAAGADGVWKTQSNDAGGYLEVTVGPCAADSSKTCGIASKAFKAPGEVDPAYPHLGKPIIENMGSDGDGKYSGGTVFDPESGKTYKSKMSLTDGGLDVEGCIAFICQGETWSRVK
jgi:uncharacterized protein (DUF2147 family)